MVYLYDRFLKFFHSLLFEVKLTLMVLGHSMGVAKYKLALALNP